MYKIQTVVIKNCPMQNRPTMIINMYLNRLLQCDLHLLRFYLSRIRSDSVYLATYSNYMMSDIIAYSFNFPG